MPAPAILVVDNYDSFVFTIVSYLAELGADVTVVRNDRGSVSAVRDYAGVLISPGPGTPQEAGESMSIIEECGAREVPMLGVCLGHQALGVVLGARVGRAEELLHGKTSSVYHDGVGVLAGLASPFVATRYHSLTIEPESVPDELVVTARTSSGVIMAALHRELPLHGVQFHPESVLTEGGYRVLANWLTLCGADDAVERSAGLTPLVGTSAGVLGEI